MVENRLSEPQYLGLEKQRLFTALQKTVTLEENKHL